MTRAKYDPLEAAKIGTDMPGNPAPPEPQPVFSPPPAPPAPKPKVEKTRAADPVPAPAPRPRYKLLADKRCSIRGTMCDFKAGRVFDSAGYDIDMLRKQGCELELVKE